MVAIIAGASRLASSDFRGQPIFNLSPLVCIWNHGAPLMAGASTGHGGRGPVLHNPSNSRL